MKKFFFSYLLLLMVTVSLGAQNFIMKSMKAKAPAEVSETETWLFNYNANYERLFGFGAGRDAEFGGWVGYNTDKLSEYNGKTITAVKIYVHNDMNNATVWIRKGNETVDKAESVAQAQANLIGGTWSYVKFEEPVTIDASTKYYIGYQANVSGNVYPIAADCTELTENERGMSGAFLISGSNEMYIDFVDDKNYQVIGHLLVAAMIDGEPDNLNTVSFRSVDLGDKVFLENGNKVAITLNLLNSGFKKVDNYEVSYSLNGGEEQNVQSEQGIEPYSLGTFKIPEIEVNDVISVSLRLSKINGVASEDLQPINVTYRGYESDKLVDRNALLLEKFTGQECGVCPSGENYVNNAVKGYESRVARVNHHYGYKEDIFTIEESAYTGYYLQVAGAPSLAVNRTCYPDKAEQMKSPGIIPFHPVLLESSFIKSELAQKTFTTIEATDSYDAETREYTVTVKGKGIFDMKGMFVTALLTQSGYLAYQANGGAEYSHDDFPILYLSDNYEGTEITTEGEEWSVTLTKKVPETIGQNVKVDLDKLELVAFVNGPLIATVPEQMALNAVTKTAATVTTSVENTEMENVNVYPEEGRIVVEGEYDSYEVYNAEGVRFSNEGLNAGLYIVKVIANGKAHTVKVMVR